MRIDTDISLYPELKKYRTIITVKAYKNDREVKNEGTLRKLFDEFLCSYNQEKAKELNRELLQEDTSVIAAPTFIDNIEQGTHPKED